MGASRAHSRPGQHVSRERPVWRRPDRGQRAGARSARGLSDERFRGNELRRCRTHGFFANRLFGFLRPAFSTGRQDCRFPGPCPRQSAGLTGAEPILPEPAGHRRRDLDAPVREWLAHSRCAAARRCPKRPALYATCFRRCSSSTKVRRRGSQGHLQPPRDEMDPNSTRSEAESHDPRLTF